MGYPMKDDYVKISRLDGTVQEITEQRRIEQAAVLLSQRCQALPAQWQSSSAEDRSMLATAFSEAPDGIFILSYDRKYIYCNKAFAGFYRFSTPDECIKKLTMHPPILEMTDNIGAIIPLDQWGFPPAPPEAIIVQADYRLRRKNTDEVWAESYRFSRLRNHKGDMVGRMVTVRDITAYQQSLTSLVTAHEKLNKLNRQMLESLAILSHELRNHLTPIMTVIPLFNSKSRITTATLGPVTF
jgi:PAS domain-containing protein